MTLPAKAEELFRKTFGHEPVVVTVAPGRIEFIGNHTDYNAGTVLGASIDRAISVAAELAERDEFVFVSDQSPDPVRLQGRPLQRQEGATSWTNYPLGVILALEARGMPPLRGLRLAVVSDLPPGAGLSSSAALELSTALAVERLAGFVLPRDQLVQACREAENNFVGVPCGILDQGVSGFGRRNHLVHIDCRGPVFSTVPLPDGVCFWIFNTHTKHELVDSLYATRHRECMEAARQLGVRWLADATSDQVRAARDRLPEVNWKRAWHVVEEIARVAAMREKLAAEDLAAAGLLLYESHKSSREWFENSTPELDFLVETLQGQPGVYGARLTGGGFGGAVMAMTDATYREPEAEMVANAYAARFGSKPDLLRTATADGARVVRGG